MSQAYKLGLGTISWSDGSFAKRVGVESLLDQIENTVVRNLMNAIFRVDQPIEASPDGNLDLKFKLELKKAVPDHLVEQGICLGWDKDDGLQLYDGIDMIPGPGSGDYPEEVVDFCQRLWFALSSVISGVTIFPWDATTLFVTIHSYVEPVDDPEFWLQYLVDKALDSSSTEGGNA